MWLALYTHYIKTITYASYLAVASLKAVAITDSPSKGATDIKRLLLLLEDNKDRGLCMISERYIFDNSSAMRRSIIINNASSISSIKQVKIRNVLTIET